jgi:hypothetical protein
LVGDFGLDPETALELILTLLRGAAYFFAGFAVVGFSAYVVFLCLEIFASQTRVKARIAKVPQPVGSAPVAERNHDLIPAETPILAEEVTVTELVRSDPSRFLKYHHSSPTVGHRCEQC